MKLIIGLGNPETKYTGTRHNVGFFMVDAYAHEKGGAFRDKAKFKAEICELSGSSEKVLLVKPTTFYNLSGEAVRAIADFYKVEPSDILVIHDELALPFGTIRSRIGGSDAGNNGIKSITEHIGPDTARIRVGIWNELRDKMDDADFVLAKFSNDEASNLKEQSKKVIDIIDDFIQNRFVITSHS